MKIKPEASSSSLPDRVLHVKDKVEEDGDRLHQKLQSTNAFRKRDFGTLNNSKQAAIRKEEDVITSKEQIISGLIPTTELNTPQKKRSKSAKPYKSWKPSFSSSPSRAAPLIFSSLYDRFGF